MDSAQSPPGSMPLSKNTTPTSQDDHRRCNEAADDKQAGAADIDASGINADDLIDRCYLCLDLDEAAIVCSICDKTVCSDCLYDHKNNCVQASATRLHHYLHSNDQGTVNTDANTGAMPGIHGKESREAKKERTLTDKDRERIAEQREAALLRRSKAIAQLVQVKRKEALARKAAIDKADEQKKKHKANFEFTDDFAHTDPSGDDPGVYAEPPTD
jgi:hypothetical protein